jgi:hypothetical protein
MALLCSKIGCSNLQFGGGFCKYHQFERRRQGGDLYAPKRKKKAVEQRSLFKGTDIPKESKTRKKAKIYYSKGCKELEAEIRAENNNKIYDFFTGLEIKGFVSWHHLLGRTGDYYTDKEYLVPAENDENDGHMFWHRATIEQLMEKPWYGEFILRLKSKCPQAYKKELRKQDKIANINKFNLESSE